MRSVIAVLLSVSIALAAATCDAGLVVHWALDESSGTAAADTSGTGNDGQFLGSPEPVWQPASGIIGGALEFASSDDVTVRSQSVPDVTGYPYTIAGWVNTTANSNDTAVVLSNGESADYSSLRVASTRAFLTVRKGDFFNIGSGAGFNNGQWHHLVGVATSSTQRDFYVDGTYIASDSREVAFLDPEPVKFSIGALDRHNIVDEYAGLVDDAALWDEALAEPEVFALNNLARHALNYNAAQAQMLFDLFEANSGEALVGGKTWRPTSGLAGQPGDVVDLPGGMFGLVLDAQGGGVQSVPEPSSLLLVLLGAAVLSMCRRRRPHLE
jgi:hypothetical protein